MYLKIDYIDKEINNKPITLLRMVTIFTIPLSYQKCINSVYSLLIKEPTCQDSAKIQFCPVNSRPMYQDFKTKNCHSTKVEPPQEIVNAPVSIITEKKPSLEIETPIFQDREDEIPPKKSVEKPKSLKRQICGKLILVETPIFRRKSLWITPKPSSIYREYHKTIPKIMNIKN